MSLLASSSEQDRKIAYGDRIIIYETFDRIKPFDVTRGGIHQCRVGIFKAEDFVGASFGSKIFDTKKKGYIYALRLTPELWTLAVKHQTQIVHISDISMVTYYLGMKPGFKVVESGTGTGSMSTSLIRTIFPDGHLYTFEYNESRADIARETFRQNGIDQYVTVQHRDVLKDGFGDELNDQIDAMFLDLPAPWDAVPHAYKVLKVDSRLCSYSPCIEQVQRTCTALRSAGFEVLTTLECLMRKYESRRHELVSPLKESKAKKRGPQVQDEPTKRARQETVEDRADDQEELDDDNQNENENENENGNENENENDDDMQATQAMQDATPASQQAAAGDPGLSIDSTKTEQKDDVHATPLLRKLEFPQLAPRLVQTRPWPEMKGHTAYLTFARKMEAKDAA